MTTWRGGPGNDTIDPGNPGGPYGSDYELPDDISGGTGSDTVNLYTNAAGPVRVTLDDRRNDGGFTYDDIDNVHTDVEHVVGTIGNDTLIGSPGAETLNGSDGHDTVRGAGGPDRLIGGWGHDTIDAVDGARDTVDCGPEADIARVDELDVVTNCESITRVQWRSIAKVRSRRLDANARRTKAPLKIACVQGRSRCAGRIIVKKNAVQLGSGSYSLRRGDTAKFTVKLNRKARKALRHHPRLKVKVKLKPSVGRGSTKRMPLTR